MSHSPSKSSESRKAVKSAPKATVKSSAPQSQALSHIEQSFDESIEMQKAFFADHVKDLVTAAAQFGKVLKNGGTIWVMGNGGSAGDAQHLSSEMVGRMILERRPLSAVALSADISTLTALGNDYGYEHVFARQIEALVRPRDIVVAISTSGNSKNILLGIDAARKKNAWVLGLTGGTGGALKNKCDLVLSARLGKNSSRIQEAHRFAIHAIVDTLDRFFLD